MKELPKEGRGMMELEKSVTEETETSLAVITDELKEEQQKARESYSGAVKKKKSGFDSF